MASVPVIANLAYLALGSNLGDRVGHLLAARNAISTLPGCQLLKRSSLYISPAWGVAQPQPDYLNAVIAVATSLTAATLLRKTAAIEAALGRVRGADRYAARTLDIDLLLVGETAMNTAWLTLPHPRMHLRAFVLLPLLELAPDIVIPGHGPARRLLEDLAGDGGVDLSQNSAWN